MKKLLLLISILFHSALWAQENLPFDYSEYLLESGMQVYVAEDFSNATVRIEYTARAGISASSKENTGFFTLYTNLLTSKLKKSENGKLFKNLQSYCGSDSSRYYVTVTPSQVQDVLYQLNKTVFYFDFSDDEIKTELSKLKTEVMEYANSPAGFINSSIDSRVFSEAPWKQDSGIYPSLFNSTSPTKARSILFNTLANFYYTPKNSAVFISGAIKKQDALKLCEAHFGNHPSDYDVPKTEKIKSVNPQKKYVIYDSQFSEEISQVIVQYTNLDLQQADLLAASFNLQSSPFKMAVLSHPDLNIRGEEYINVASAHKNGNSRVIFQTLLEASKMNPLEQAEIFINEVKNASSNTDFQTFFRAKNNLINSFNEVTKNSSVFMDYLSQFWAIQKYVSSADDGGKTLAAEFFDRPFQLENQDFESLKKLQDEGEPFVFLLLNNKTYNKYASLLKKQGYEPVNMKNGSWYTQKLFTNASAIVKEEKQINEPEKQLSPYDYFTQYSEKNQKDFYSFKLKNGIPVIFKKNPSSSGVVILIGIKGGKFSGNETPEFNTVMTNSFASNIQSEILKQRFFTFSGDPEILADADWFYNTITVECNKKDLPDTVMCIIEALIYTSVSPVDADSCVYSIQTQKRLYNASPVNQLTSKAINYLYKDKKYRSVFDSESSVLENITYEKILAAYPAFLDAKLYNIVITGNLELSEVENAMNKTFSQLLSQPEKASSKTKKIPEPYFDRNKKLSVKLRHLFYTDVAAKDAGPMPAVLIPTKDFSDPVQYWVKSPDFENEDFEIFNALCQFISEKIREKALEEDSAGEVLLSKASKTVPASSFTLLNVKHTSKADSVYASTIEKIKQLLQNPEEKENVRKNIIENWIIENLSQTQTNRGTALIINKGVQERGNGNYYLKVYEKIAGAGAEEYWRVMETYFPSEPQLKLYSSDSKK